MKRRPLSNQRAAASVFSMLLLRRPPFLPVQLLKSRSFSSLLPSKCLPKTRLLLPSRSLTSYRSRPTSLSLYRSAATFTPSNSSDELLPSSAAVYTPPTTGVLSLLPPSWVPFAELTRLDKPTGTIYLLLPCLWSTVMAASLTTPVAPITSVLYTSFLFTSGALIMRGAGCTINDLWDRNIDGKVTRTQSRPLARRAVTARSAVLFAGAQCLTGLALLVQFPLEVIVAALPSMFVVTTYPAMKRFINYPQVVLGMAFSWGAMLGFPAMGLSLLDPVVGGAAACLYASNVAWTVLYDTIYAHQDIKDDKKVGVKSTAIANEGRTRLFLSALGVAQISLLAGAGVIAGMGPAFYVGSCGGAAVGLGWMIRRANFKKVEDCWWWFKWCAWTVGGVAVGGGLVGEYAVRRLGEETVVQEVA